MSSYSVKPVNLSQLTKPFEVVNNEPQSVKNKFLEGVPYSHQNFPGPFLGKTPQQMQNYRHLQSNAIKQYPTISEEPLEFQAELYPTFNEGVGTCSELGSRIPTFPPVQPGRQQGGNNPGIEYSQNINRSFGTNKDPNVERFSNEAEEDDLDDFRDDSITNPQSQTGFGNIVPKFREMPEHGQVKTDFVKCSAEDNPLLDIENRPIEQFSHNNMVPYYGSKLTQNMSVTGVPQAGDNNSCKGLTDGFSNATPYRGKLETFTGTDEMWMHKRETGPLFSPAEQQTGWVFGTPAFRPDLDRYKTQVWKRHGETPVEAVKVGPGLAVDYTTPATGGFQQFTRVNPNNVSDYKANQLEGRVNAGSWKVSHPTSQYIHGVKKNRPDVEITQARRPTQPGKFTTNAPSAGSARVTDYTLSAMQGKQARSDTEQSAGFGQFNLETFTYDGSGKLTRKENFVDNRGMPCVDFSSAPVGMTMKSHVPQSSQARDSYNNIRETFRRGAAGYSEKDGFWECRDKTQGQERWGLIMGPAKGATPMGETRDGKYVNYTERGDVNPYVINVTGTASKRGGVWNPNSYSQPARTTRKETLEYSHTGNIQSSRDGAYLNTWSDTPRVTTRETTEFSHSGNMQSGRQGFYKNQWESDPLKVTRKETTNYAHAGNASQGGTAFMDRSMFTGSTILPKN